MGLMLQAGDAVRYTKPSLTCEQQADLLLSRGLVADREALIAILSEISYYRLSGYFFPFRNHPSDSFRKDTAFQEVFDQYLFDRQLRVAVMDGVERVEVAVKARLVNALTIQHGPFAHTDRSHFPKMSPETHRRLMEKIHHATEHSTEIFVKHYFNTYTSEMEVPLWIASEIMDFGAMLTLYRNADQHEMRKIAQAYGISGKVMESWLVSLNVVRNICAHHGRLWNRVLAVPFVIPAPKHRMEFHLPQTIRGDSSFAVLSVLRYMLSIIAPKSQWASRIKHLVSVKHPGVPLKHVGFPENWMESPLWT